MALIEVENLTKQFKREKKKPGLSGAVKSLFNRDYEIKTAVDGISFQIEKGAICDACSGSHIVFTGL